MKVVLFSKRRHLYYIDIVLILDINLFSRPYILKGMRKLFCVLVILLNICWVNIALAQNTNPNYGVSVPKNWTI
jgi:hypothetical protein